MEDLRWLQTLHTKLWERAGKPVGDKSPVAAQAQRYIDQTDLERVFLCVERHRLVTAMFSSNMFGGYGMHVYGPPVFPGTPLEILLSIIEDNLPPPGRYEHINGTAKPIPERKPGCGRDDAWELFSKYTHSEQNRTWLEHFRMDPPRSRSHYDY